MQKIIFLLFTVISLTYGTNEYEKTFLQEIPKVYTNRDGLPEARFEQIHFDNEGNPVAIGSQGTFFLRGGQWQSYLKKLQGKEDKAGELLPDEVGKIYAVVSHSDNHYVGAEKGLYVFAQDQDRWVRVLPSDEKYSWALSHVKVLQVDIKGRLWFGAAQGVGYLENKDWHLFSGREGLPCKDFTCLTAGSDGSVWFGTEKGVIRADGEHFFYRFSRRWIPDDHVNDIAMDSKGNVWIATNKGLSRISFVPMTLEEKATYFTEQVEKRHNRIGFICQNHLKERYQVDSWTPAISDNDGLYTAMYGSAMAFRYALTGEPQARALAVRSFNACKWLVDITHESGFPARVIIPVDWPEPVNEQYGHEYNVRAQQSDPFWKDIFPRFPLSKDGKYRWKCDTSSDELAGHYFFYGIYYDLVAKTEEEKKAVREVVGAITDHLIRHGFVLVDHDGKPTRWANFSPEYFNSVWGWDQRGLNSMMMLSFLNVAGHVTGDPKYDKVAKELREKHDYHINAMQSKMFFPPDDVVPWDNNLCLMSMYGLMNYEDDPELMMMYRESLENAWLHISRQKNAFWNIIYAALAHRFNEWVDSGKYHSGKVFTESPLYAPFTARQFYKKEYQREDILETLTRLPLDLIGYHMDNTHRLDIIFDPTPGQVPGIGWHVSGGALRIDERGHVRQDRDAFAIDYSEGDGWSEHEGTYYLLPYYMARYHGIIR